MSWFLFPLAGEKIKIYYIRGWICSWQEENIAKGGNFYRKHCRRVSHDILKTGVIPAIESIISITKADRW